MQKRSLFAVILVTALIGLTGCATDGSTQSAVRTDDATLNHQVSEAIRNVPGIQANDISVATDNGAVTLKGRTATQREAQDAIEAARHVPGVKTVDYDISVDKH